MQSWIVTLQDAFAGLAGSANDAAAAATRTARAMFFLK